MAPRTIAIYGKGGIGKSFTTTNLSATFAMMNKRVLQLGCDPKHDSTTSLFGGISLPTVTEVFAEKNAKNEQVEISDIVFRRDIPGFPQPIYGIELGGPQVGRGCGGRGIISGFDVLEKLGIFEWDIDIILMDFLGDVVCGGFATPLARSLSEEVLLVTSNDRQSIFTSNNICQANNYFRTIGGRSRLLGLIVNRNDGSGMAESYAKTAGINVLMKVPYNLQARDMDDSFDFAIKLPEVGEPFRKLATDILNNAITPCEASGLDFKDFVRLFGDVSEELPAAATADELFKRSSGNREEASKPSINTPADAATDSERQQLLACIEKLPEPERELYTLLEIEGKSPEQIANLKGLGEQEVKAYIATARKAMRKLFFEL
ncbi:chlorophyllide a reductase iron protein subunit X [Chlorobaculum sp. MV4-Y]|jgi:chlorophyllide a reductase subunit X|uniref:chlorophyllide a reductase iron protein subunit X n=1 Tax=Chlorobaculum sp. MV4-Y TaxID=2976335 RepID=UPI0021B05CFB|nr:chlorophyllide a reductase iron protein subunit X [Chlorobaculum sp. MV4-Y]UWX58214.1 chlorophyllide a reductase iron protein subunit X [Chlorobaculum sp. MV4-Y]